MRNSPRFTAVDHGNLVGLGIGANATAEAASQAHQVVVVEGRVGTGSASPPSPETGGFVPHSIVAIEYDAIDTIITAAQKVLVNLAQSLGHGGNTTTHGIFDSTAEATPRIATGWLIADR